MYQSILFVASADCGFTESRKCDPTPGAAPGRMMKYDFGSRQWFLESDTSVCCGYAPDATINVEGFVTEEFESIDIVIPEGMEAPTLEEIETAIDAQNGTTTSTGGVPIVLVGAVGIIAIAGIVMATSGKKG
jgi:hypothetical protein